MSIDPGSITFGLDTFGDVTVDSAGDPVAPAQVIRDIVDRKSTRLNSSHD